MKLRAPSFRATRHAYARWPSGQDRNSSANRSLALSRLAAEATKPGAVHPDAPTLAYHQLCGPATGSQPTYLVPGATGETQIQSWSSLYVQESEPDEWLQALPLREFFVDRGAVEEGQRALARILDSACERDVQQVIEKYPRLLVHNLCARMGWVIPQKHLGSEFVTDFLVAEQLSPGFCWQAVELESPRAPMFTKAGDPSRQLTHAIRQIQDWRAWVASNQPYASGTKRDNGLGLQDISPNLPGLIRIGRRHATAPETNALRRQMMADLRIEIRTFDEQAVPIYVRFGDRAWGLVVPDLGELEAGNSTSFGQAALDSGPVLPG